MVHMKDFADNALKAVVYIGCLLVWAAGAVLAEGAWKAVAVFFPPYALYKVVERAMQMMGVV
jgi:hypothetical protein